MRKLIRNSIRTPDGTQIVSTHRHDFVEYTDANGQYYAVDGGNEYTRILYDKQDYVDTSVYADDDFELVREAFTWGTYGKNGDQPLKRKMLKDLDYDHIEAIIKTQTQLSQNIVDIFQKELDYRKDDV